MKTQTHHSAAIQLEPKDNDRLASLCGPFNENIRQLETASGVDITSNNFSFTISGPKKNVDKICSILKVLYNKTEKEKNLTQNNIHIALKEANIEFNSKDKQSNNGYTVHQLQTKNTLVKPLGQNQQEYLNNVLEHDITFGIGPAGTGKTYLAVACAAHALEQQSVERLVLVRPAVEAGERLGFLPGDYVQKVDPYLRPLYDALYEILGVEKVNKHIENKVIEVAPIAYMRGRTLNHSFIILDESQNTTIEQMKMFLTRIGFGSKTVITGDITQIDLPRDKPSGLKHAIKLLSEVDGISFNYFKSKDVIRHPLVQKIIDAYQRDEHNKNAS